MSVRQAGPELVPTPINDIAADAICRCWQRLGFDGCLSFGKHIHVTADDTWHEARFMRVECCLPDGRAMVYVTVTHDGSEPLPEEIEEVCRRLHWAFVQRTPWLNERPSDAG